MTLGRGKIFPEKVNALAIIFIVSTSVTSSAMAQILPPPPLPENLIEEIDDGIRLFSLGYGAGVAKYMCFESPKGNLSKSEGERF